MIDKLNQILQGLIERSVELDGGWTSMPIVEAGSYVDQSIPFNKEFSAIPNVVVSLMGRSTSGRTGSVSCAVLSGTITKTGFTVRLWNADTTDRNPGVTWIAAKSVGGGVLLKRVIQTLKHFLQRRCAA